MDFLFCVHLDAGAQETSLTVSRILKKRKKAPEDDTGSEDWVAGELGGWGGGYLLESEWLAEKLTLGGFGERDQVSEDGIKHIFSTLDGVLQRVPE